MDNNYLGFYHVTYQQKIPKMISGARTPE
jgi:hypothetical protein